MFGFSRKGESKGSYNKIGLEGSKYIAFVQHSNGNEESYSPLKEEPCFFVCPNSETPSPISGDL